MVQLGPGPANIFWRVMSASDSLQDGKFSSVEGIVVMAFVVGSG